MPGDPRAKDRQEGTEAGCALSREIQQGQYVNPKQCHEVPIPGGHVDDDAARLGRAAQPGCQTGIEQREYSAEQVHGVDARQQEEEAAAEAGAEICVQCRNSEPGVVLSSEKGDA